MVRLVSNPQSAKASLQISTSDKNPYYVPLLKHEQNGRLTFGLSMVCLPCRHMYITHFSNAFLST
jgi:hypothetical protein